MALKKYKDFRGEVKLIKEINPEAVRVAQVRPK